MSDRAAGDSESRGSHTSTTRTDRRLGDEWKNWDGRAVEESSAGKRLFLSLSAGSLVFMLLVGWLEWYLIAPRLASWSPVAPMVVLYVMLALAAVPVVVFISMLLSLVTGSSLPGPLMLISQVLLQRTEGLVCGLGRLLAVDPDRLANSWIRIHNALTTAGAESSSPERLLILAPRCLSKLQLRETKRLADDFGVRIAVVAGGERARELVLEHRPSAIVGIACERDLVSGIRDVSGRIRVLGVPNRRPCGPCKDTCVDLDELKDAIELFVERRDNRAA